MYEHGKARLFSAYNEGLGLSSYMPVTILILIGFLILTFLLLRYTMVGRGIYALGGDEISAKIAQREFERAQLFCGTDTGIHIAASKCPHVHATVVQSVAAAKRAIIGNNVNVLA